MAATRSDCTEDVLGPGEALHADDNILPATAVQNLGVTKLPGILSLETAEELLGFVLQEFHDSCAAAVDDPVLQRDRFSAGLLQQRSGVDHHQTRWDLKLPLAPVVRKALRELLRSQLGEAIMSLAGGADAELWELAAIISAPGAVSQVVHRDTKYSVQPCLFTVLVALQDVSQDMGPTRFLPGSHTEEEHLLYDTDPLAYLCGARSAVAILGTGDGSLFDSRLLHCGGANRSEKNRVLLTVTFRHVHSPARLKNLDRSLRPIYKTLSLRLGQFYPNTAR